MPGYIASQMINTGSFVPTTNVWDPSQLADINVNSQEFKELLVRLYQNLNLMAVVLNQKDSAFYTATEFVTGGTLEDPLRASQLFIRPIFRITFIDNPLPMGVTTIAHGLTIGTTWNFLIIQGAATDNIGFNYYPLPFASADGAHNIEVKVDNTNVVITNNSGVAFTSSEIFLEYVKY